MRFLDHALFWVFAVVCVLFCILLPFGCAPPGAPSGPVIPAYGMDQFRPNYGGDLDSTQIWPKTGTATTQSAGTAIIAAPDVVTYRIVHATSDNVFDINLLPTMADEPSAGEIADIEGDVAKWQAALGLGRTLQEVADGTRTANIEIMVVDRSAITQPDSAFLSAIGETDRFSDDTTGYLARVVIKLTAQSDERNFRLLALHELGHGLDCDGHSRATGDVMYGVDLLNVPVVGIGDIELSQRDINTVRAAYFDR